MRISDWSSDVCSSDLRVRRRTNGAVAHRRTDRDQSFRRAAAGRCRTIRRHEEEREILAQIFVVDREVLTDFVRRLEPLGELPGTTGDEIWPIPLVDQAIGPDEPRRGVAKASAPATKAQSVIRIL